MPIRYKHTWFFNLPNKGWSESLYTQPSSEGVQAQMNQAREVAIARAGMLGTGGVLQAYRVQQVENAAGEPVKRVGDILQSEQFGGPLGALAQPDISMMFDFATVGKDFHKMTFAGGIPDDIENAAGGYTPNAAWVSAWQNWGVKLVAGGGYGWLSRVPSALSYGIVTMVNLPEGFVDFEFSGTPFAGASNNSQVVRISGATTVGGLSGINGDVLIRPTGVNTATTVKQIAILPYQGGGVMRTYTRAYRAIDSIYPEKIVSRERGAPLLQSRGRRKARRRT